MKRILTLILCLMLMLSLCACPALEGIAEQTATPTQTDTPAQTRQPTAPTGKAVHITVGKIEPGMTAKDVFAEVTIDGRPVACRIGLTGFAWDGYWEMAGDEPVPEDFSVRVDIYYSLPAGCDVEDMDITMDSDGGNYDGTGSISVDAQGNVEAWSRAFYGKEPLPPEDTQPTEPAEPTEPTETTPPTQTHTHSWTEIPGPSFLDCSLDRVKNYQCSCGATKQETVPAPGHEWKPWNETPATCTDDGQKTTSCKHCSAGLTVDIPATGHTWSGWVKDTGLLHKRTCSVCGAEETAKHNIPAGEVTCTDCGADIIN